MLSSRMSRVIGPVTFTQLHVITASICTFVNWKKKIGIFAYCSSHPTHSVISEICCKVMQGDVATAGDTAVPAGLRSIWNLNPLIDVVALHERPSARRVPGTKTEGFVWLSVSTCSGVCFERPLVSHILKKLSPFLWNPNIYCLFYRRLSPGFIPSQINYFYKF